MPITKKQISIVFNDLHYPIVCLCHLDESLICVSNLYFEYFAVFPSRANTLQVSRDKGRNHGFKVGGSNTCDVADAGVYFR